MDKCRAVNITQAADLECLEYMIKKYKYRRRAMPRKKYTQT